MRIAQVNDIAAVASTLADAQRSLGHEVDLLGTTRPIVNRNRWFRLISAPFRMLGMVAVAVPIRRGRYDVVHVHYSWKAVAAVLAGHRYVLHCHGSDVRDIRGGLRGWLNRRLERRAAIVYFATPDLAAWVKPNRRDAMFLPNPIDTAAFNPDHAAGRGSSEPGASGAVRDVLVGVRLDAIKGAAVLVDTIRAIRRIRPDTTFTIVAQGALVGAAMESAGECGELVARCERDALPALYRRHRVALGQMLVGALGNYELEAMSAGLPVAMRFVYGTAYRTPPPLLNAGTAEEAAELICAVLDDPTRRETLAEEGREWVAANHEAGAVARRVLGDYERTGFRERRTDASSR